MKGVLTTAPEAIPIIAKAIDNAVSEIEAGLNETAIFRTGMEIENKNGTTFIIAVCAIPKEEWIDREKF